MNKPRYFAMILACSLLLSALKVVAAEHGGRQLPQSPLPST